MAKCIKCGRALPAFSFGKLRNTCQWCQDYEAAQRGEDPSSEVQKVMPAPWVRNPDGISVTQILLGANFLVFICMALAGTSPFEPTSQQLLNSGANCGYFVFTGQWWRLFTSMFVHIGVIHIAFNMWCLWDLGALAEKMYGRWTFLTVYILCGVSGSLTSVAYDPMRVSAGASGAIFGIAGALISSYKLGSFSLPQSIIRASLRSVVAFAGYNLVLGTIMSRTDNAAHIGGLVAGLVLGALLALLAPGRGSTVPRLTILTLIALLLFGGLVWADRTRSYDAHAGRGDDYLSRNKLPEAIREFELVARQRPNSVEAHMDLARVYSVAGESQKAEGEYQRVIQLDPNREDAHYWLAMSYVSRKDYPQAESVFEQFLKKKSNSAFGHMGLGVVLAAKGDHLAAIKEYQAAAQLDPTLSYLHFELGTSYAQLKQYDQAIAAFLQEQKNSGDDSDLQLALASAYDAKGMKQQAEDARQKARQLQPEDTQESDED